MLFRLIKCVTPNSSFLFIETRFSCSIEVMLISFVCCEQSVIIKPVLSARSKTVLHTVLVLYSPIKIF